MEQSKNKECKKRYHKKSATKVFQACVALFWNLASALVLALHCYKLLEKKRLPVITWNKKYSSKQVAPITHTLKEIFFGPIAF